MQSIKMIVLRSKKQEKKKRSKNNNQDLKTLAAQRLVHKWEALTAPGTSYAGQNLGYHFRCTVSESAFLKDPQVIHVHIKLEKQT